MTLFFSEGKMLTIRWLNDGTGYNPMVLQFPIKYYLQLISYGREVRGDFGDASSFQRARVAATKSSSVRDEVGRAETRSRFLGTLKGWLMAVGPSRLQQLLDTT